MVQPEEEYFSASRFEARLNKTTNNARQAAQAVNDRVWQGKVINERQTASRLRNRLIAEDAQKRND